MRTGLWRLGLGFGLLLGGAVGVYGMQQSSQRPVTPPSLDAAPAETSDAALMRLHEQQMSAADTQRHKRMVADTDKLLTLATELKVEVDKSTKNELSVVAVKKAADIEKLAHDVKERMKGY